MIKTAMVATVIAGLAGFVAGSARADTITQTFTLGAINGLTAGEFTSENSPTNINRFDSTLGTLTSIAVTTTATGTFSGGASNASNELSYDLDINGTFHTFSTIADGNSTISVPLSYNPKNLSNFIGTGTFFPRIEVYNKAVTASLNASFSNESIVYTYAPLAAVPEPASLPIFAFGLVALGWASRRCAHQ